MAGWLVTCLVLQEGLSGVEERGRRQVVVRVEEVVLPRRQEGGPQHKRREAASRPAQRMGDWWRMVQGRRGGEWGEKYRPCRYRRRWGSGCWWRSVRAGSRPPRRWGACRGCPPGRPERDHEEEETDGQQTTHVHIDRQTDRRHSEDSMVVVRQQPVRSSARRLNGALT